MWELIEEYSTFFLLLISHISLDVFSFSRHYIGVHLSPHLHDLMNLIRTSAVVFYFQPFATIKLDRMSATSGWAMEEVKHHVMDLIQFVDIQGRMDSQKNNVRVYYAFFFLINLP